MPTDPPRYLYSAPHVTLETCDALRFTFEPDGLTQVIVWRDRPSLVRPVETGKRLRALRAGDEVELDGERRVVRVVEAWR